MLTPAEIIATVASGEGYGVEFKVRVPAKVRELAAVVSAFANAAGGALLLRIDDQNQVLGLTLDNAKRSAVQYALQEISPHLHCPFYSVEATNPSGLVSTIPLQGLGIRSHSRNPLIFELFGRCT